MFDRFREYKNMAKDKSLSKVIRQAEFNVLRKYCILNKGFIPRRQAGSCIRKSVNF